MPLTNEQKRCLTGKEVDITALFPGRQPPWLRKGADFKGCRTGAHAVERGSIRPVFLSHSFPSLPNQTKGGSGTPQATLTAEPPAGRPPRPPPPLLPLAGRRRDRVRPASSGAAAPRIPGPSSGPGGLLPSPGGSVPAALAHPCRR